jgi:hypothetical protein
MDGTGATVGAFVWVGGAVGAAVGAAEEGVAVGVAVRASVAFGNVAAGPGRVAGDDAFVDAEGDAVAGVSVGGS